jgi:hypothetical protein
MDIKGTAVVAIRDFVKSNHPEQYNKWLNELSEEAREIYTGAIDSSKWYPIKTAGVEPTRKAIDLFYQGNYEKGAWEAGKFSAHKALTGIYKLFVKASSPGFIIQRASRIFATYYQPCKMDVLEKTDSSVLLEISNMTVSDIVIEYRIGGWIEEALEISGAKNITIKFLKSIAKGDAVTRIYIKWN